MTSFRTSALALLAALLAGCSFGTPVLLADRTLGEVVLEGFAEIDGRWETSGNRYWQATAEDDGLLVTNSSLGSGVSPIWYRAEAPVDVVIAVRATIEKEGLDGGWGVEFGTQDGKYGYRALVYASGRLCVDRVFGVYPEFIHCIPYQPEVKTGDATNVLAVRVVGDTISVSVNQQEIVEFTDERFKPGGLSLAVAGAGTRVFFEDVVIMSLD